MASVPSESSPISSVLAGCAAGVQPGQSLARQVQVPSQQRSPAQAMPRGYLWCDAPSGAGRVRHYYETDGRLLRWKQDEDEAAELGSFDLGHFCEDREGVRVVGASATQHGERELFCFEIFGPAGSRQLFAASDHARATWITGLRNTLLAAQLQTPAESAEDVLGNLRASRDGSLTARTADTPRSAASASSRPAERGRTSVGLVLDGTTISAVIKGSPASAADVGGCSIEANDCLVSVDGTDVDGETALEMLRGDDEIGSVVSVQIRKGAESGATFVASLCRMDVHRIQEVAALYHLAESLAKKPGAKALVPKVAEKVKEVVELDSAILGVLTEHVASLEQLVRTTFEAQRRERAEAGSVILAQQTVIDDLLFSGPERGEAGREAEVSKAEEICDALRNRVADLESELTFTKKILRESTVREDETSQPLVTKRAQPGEFVQGSATRDSEGSLHTAREDAFWLEDTQLLKDKNAMIDKLEEEASSLQRELERRTDALQEIENATADDVAKIIGDLHKSYHEKVEALVSEREELKERVRASDQDKDLLQQKIERLEGQLGDVQQGSSELSNEAQQSERSKFDTERGALMQQMQHQQRQCDEQVLQMEQLVLSARLEAAHELAEEKRAHAHTQSELREAGVKMTFALEKLEDAKRAEEASNLEISRLTNRVDVSSAQVRDAEKQLYQEMERSRKDIEQLEIDNLSLRATIRGLETIKDQVPALREDSGRFEAQIQMLEDTTKTLRASELKLESKLDAAQQQLAHSQRSLEESMATERHLREQLGRCEHDKERLAAERRKQQTEVEEAQLRLSEAEVILEETMVMIEAPSVVAIPRVAAALKKDAGNKEELLRLRARIKESDSMVDAMCDLLNVDAAALPKTAARLKSQCVALANTQIHLEEEVRSLRAQIQGDKRKSGSDLEKRDQELKLLKAEGQEIKCHRDELQANLLCVQQEKERIVEESRRNDADCRAAHKAEIVELTQHLRDREAMQAGLEGELEACKNKQARDSTQYATVCDERDALLKQLQLSRHELQVLSKERAGFVERFELLEQSKARLEKENTDHLECISRAAATNVLLRQDLETKTKCMDSRDASHEMEMREIKSKLSRGEEEVGRLREQRDATLAALDALQQEAKQSHLHNNRLSSNFDAVEKQIQHLSAQRNSAIGQANQYREETERLRNITVQMQYKISALQAAVAQHQTEGTAQKAHTATGQEAACVGNGTPGQLTTNREERAMALAAEAAAVALEAKERERRRTKELMGVVATVWEYRGKEVRMQERRRSQSRERNGHNGARSDCAVSHAGNEVRVDGSKADDAFEKRRATAMAQDEGSTVTPLPQKQKQKATRTSGSTDVNPRESSLIDTFSGIFGRA